MAQQLPLQVLEVPARRGKTDPEGDPETLFEESWLSIQVNMDLIEPAAAFTYLVRAIVYNNTDWAAVYHNIWV